MPEEHILLILSNPQTIQALKHAILMPAGYRVTHVYDWKTAQDVFKRDLPDLVILSEKLENNPSIEIAKRLIDTYPFIPFILLPEQHSENLLIEALRNGFTDYLRTPVKSHDVLEAIARVLEHRRRIKDQIQLAAKRNTKSLRERVKELEAIHRVGQQVTSLLDLDKVLTAVVDAAVDLTGAQEGSLLISDEDTGELYMRAGRNFQEDFVRTFRLPIRDTWAGEVIRTGKPLLIDEKTPQKIKTAYLVYSILYVPLIINERVIGVLEVDNRNTRTPFSEYHVSLVSALADYAAIAIENARLYSHTQIERNNVVNILTKIEEAVIVIDQDRRILYLNRKASEAFGVEEKDCLGKHLQEVINHQEMLETIKERDSNQPSRAELTLADGRVLNAQLTPIPQFGLVMTMQDITYLKELDRIKSDFVNTVSHDLRSPLTAILGYVELIDRVGMVNDQQREFIRRVQISVNNITSLINDLLDLGRIEAGFDARKEIVPFSGIIELLFDTLKTRADAKSIELILDIQEKLPHLLGNPNRLRQMLNNLISNAIKYTPPNGKIHIFVRSEGSQIILQISDNGPGIPPSDQPYIFDKFFRASNVPSDTPGTGLGLAIVKSIVESHQGRVWVESNVGHGTTFTVVLPTSTRGF